MPTPELYSKMMMQLGQIKSMASEMQETVEPYVKEDSEDSAEDSDINYPEGREEDSEMDEKGKKDKVALMVSLLKKKPDEER